MATAYVALGANIGDPRSQVREAMDALDTSPGIRVGARSRLYVTPPWGVLDQPAFVNAAVCIETDLSPHDLLQRFMQLEQAAGRVRGGRRWGPRLLDLDLLVYGQQILDEPGLQLPHPRIAQRAFVLLPLAEIAPELHIPGQGLVRHLLQMVDVDGCLLVEAEAVARCH